MRINQVLINLIGNAIKFTNNGYVKLNIDLINEDDEKLEIKFSVEDSGIGINQNNLYRIFERFEQASDDITRKYGGSGLGLSISKNLVELLGGKISIISEYGKGSNFYFNLIFNKMDLEGIEKVLKKNIFYNKDNSVVNCEIQKDNFNRELVKILTNNECVF